MINLFNTYYLTSAVYVGCTADILNKKKCYYRIKFVHLLRSRLYTSNFNTFNVKIPKIISASKSKG